MVMNTRPRTAGISSEAGNRAWWNRRRGETDTVRQATVTERATAAPPPSTPGRRQRVVWMAIGAAILLAVAAVGVGLWATNDDPDQVVEVEQPVAGAIEGVIQWQGTVVAGTFPAVAGDDFVLTGQDARDLGGERAMVRRFDQVTGAEEWSTELDSPVAFPAGVADDVVVVVGDGSISGLDVNEGAVRWQFVAGAVPGSPVSLLPAEAGTDRVFVGGDTLTAIDPTSGTALWDLAVEVDQITVTGEILVATGDGQVHGVDVDAGTLRWTHDLGNGAPFGVPPVVVDDDVAIASRLGDVALLDLEDGGLRYHVLLDDRGTAEGRTEGAGDETELDRAVALDVDPDAGVIVVGGETGTIYGVAVDNGERMWNRVVRADLDVRDAVTVHREDDLVIVGGPGSPDLSAYRLADGLLEWGFDLTGEATADTAPLVTHDHVVAAADSADGRDLVGLDPADGSEQWRVGVAQAVTAPLLAHDGLVYIVAEPVDPDEASVLFAVR